MNESIHRAPFPAGADDWEPQTATPWYSMTRRGPWYRVEPTSGNDPVSVLVVDSEDRVLMVESYRAALDRICLETPRGFRDANETAAQAAARELGEETGLLIAPEALADLGRVAQDSGILSTRVHLFGFRLDHPFGAFGAGDGEILSRRLVPLADLEAMALAGEMEDVFVIASLVRWQARGMERPTSPAGRITRQIEVLDADEVIVSTIETDRPDWSFKEFCRNRDSAGWRWRFAQAPQAGAMEVLDAAGNVLVRIETDDPQTSFEAWRRNRGDTGLSWRRAAPEA